MFGFFRFRPEKKELDMVYFIEIPEPDYPGSPVSRVLDSAPPTNMGWPKKYLKWIALAILSGAISLGIGEAIMAAWRAAFG